MPPSPITALFMSLSLSLPLFLLLLSFIFLRIFFFPLHLLQFGFYTFIINDDFGLGLIKGSDFGRRKQKFWVEKMVILGESAVSASLQLLLLLGIEEWVRESLTRQERRERKKYKIIDRRATVAMHICTVTVVIVHKCTILHPLMWMFFCSKCVK